MSLGKFQGAPVTEIYRDGISYMMDLGETGKRFTSYIGTSRGWIDVTEIIITALKPKDTHNFYKLVIKTEAGVMSESWFERRSDSNINTGDREPYHFVPKTPAFLKGLIVDTKERAYVIVIGPKE